MCYMTKGVLKVDARKGLRLLLDLFLIELWTLAAIPPDHDRHRNEERRIRTGNDTDEHREREIEDRTVTEAEEREHSKERGERSDDRTRKRHVERTVAELCRKAAKKIVESEGSIKRVSIDQKDVASYLGGRKVLPELSAKEDLVGVPCPAG